MSNLQRIQIRYFPPGLNLIFKQHNKFDEQELDLYGFDPFTSQESTFITQLISQHHLNLEKYSLDIEHALKKISRKYGSSSQFHGYSLKKSLKVHKQPLTNCMFSKHGDKFATASFDRTCNIWDTTTGKLCSSLSGHKNAVFCLDFSRFSQKQLIATGSLDYTAKVWTSSGNQIWTFKDHKGEISAIKFNPSGLHLLTSSIDNTIKLWDIQKGKLITTLIGHEAEVVKLDHNYNGDLILSSSFDYSAKIWDLKTKTCVRSLIGHQGEINCGKFQYTGEICATGGNDNICIIWDVGSGKQIQSTADHSKEIYDLDFTKVGNMLATCSADSTAKIYRTNTSALLHSLQGHLGEVTRVLFNPQGNRLITTGMDGIARIWSSITGQNVGLLEGHKEQIFSCDIDYFGNHIITCSKDNVCNIWEAIN